MTITTADVRIRASQRMTDFDDGGGPMSTVVIVDGVMNNVFDNIPDTDRLHGRLSLRKVYGAALNNSNDRYISAHMLLDDKSDDSNVDDFLLSTGGVSTQRVAALAAIPQPVLKQLTSTGSPGAYGGVDYVVTGTFSDTTHIGATISNAATLAMAYATTALMSIRMASGIAYLRTIISEASGVYLLDAAVPGGTIGVTAQVSIVTMDGIYGEAETPGSTSSGASSVVVDTVLSRVIPCALDAAFPTVQDSTWQAPPLAEYKYTQGQLRVIKPGDSLLISNTVSMSPATVANGDTKDTTRVTLQRLRVIGNNGTVHGTFIRGQTPPSVGFEADLDAGTVHFTNVAGLSQPVTVESRFEEMAVATTVSVGSKTIGLNRLLSRAYPAGSKVSSLVMFGDWQGRTGTGFPQSAWTGVFSDTVIGGTPTADFNHLAYPWVMTNKGAITERWAFIFTNTTTYRCIGEQVGELANGSTAVDYAPVNPATGVPYFTIPAGGWGGGWAAGNVYRQNTIGANGPLWAGRCVCPSAPSDSADSMTIQLRGYNN